MTPPGAPSAPPPRGRRQRPGETGSAASARSGQGHAPGDAQRQGHAEPVDFAVRGDHITLDALLKATGLASSGGAAKALIAEGRVRVDGQPELRRGCKLRPGQVVGVDGQRVRLVRGPA